MKNRWKIGVTILFVGCVLFFGPSRSSADDLNTTFSVTFDTSSLVGQSGLELAFVLVDGSGLGDDNTTITLNNFSFGTGSGPSSASLQDNQFFTLVTDPFVAGSALSFTVGIASTNLDQPTPDSFEFAILGALGLPIATTDPSGLDSLILTDLTNPFSPQVSDVSATSTVPEPASFVLFGAALMILGFAQLRRRHRYV
jgi:hypothetical protein